MSYFTHSASLVTMPLTLQHHYYADQLRQHHAGLRAKQVFLNALVVQAIADYLRCIGVHADFKDSELWNPCLQMLSESSGLWVPNGILECRPVLPDAETCWIPPETWSDRLGYVAVQVNAELTEASIIGFLPSVENEQVPLTRFYSIEALLDVLEPPSEVVSQQLGTAITELGQWLQGAIASGWQTVDELIDGTPTFSFRSAESSDETWTTRGKVIMLPALPDISERYSLEIDTPERQLILFVGILPATDTEMEVWVRVCPIATVDHLPHDLLIQVLDVQGVAVMQAQSRQTNMIQLRFQCAYGESFGLRLSLNNWSMTESFTV